MIAINKAGITLCLEAIADGQPDAEQTLFDLTYGELRSLASHMMARQHSGHTLQATALVNEATMRMMNADSLGTLTNRKHFFAAMAKAMRCVLVDHAKRRNAQKRGGEYCRVELDSALDEIETFAEVDIIDLDAALTKLALLNERHYQMVQLRFFLGMTVNEIMEQLEVSKSTVERDWRFVRAWLAEELDR